MELTTRQTTAARPPSTVSGGHEEFDIVAGKTLRIETSPGGTEVLAVTVPAGKKWRVMIGVEVVETDA